MANQFSRTQLLLGQEAMEQLASSRVAVFGIGGVGGYVVDAVDIVSAKIKIVLRAQEKNVPVVSCMGAGNKLEVGA